MLDSQQHACLICSTHKLGALLGTTHLEGNIPITLLLFGMNKKYTPKMFKHQGSIFMHHQMKFDDPQFIFIHVTALTFFLFLPCFTPSVHSTGKTECRSTFIKIIWHV
ncbi:hypothetical protein ID866_11545 [Astraeus odoratus]|nr:hypothetical protein ID866_11545 [Astraeus odoratus]